MSEVLTEFSRLLPKRYRIPTVFRLSLFSLILFGQIIDVIILPTWAIKILQTILVLELIGFTYLIMYGVTVPKASRKCPQCGAIMFAKITMCENCGLEIKHP